MAIVSASKTDPGLVRTNNEDSLFTNDNIPLFVVADGMGGHLGGEVASQMAISIISDYVKENHESHRSPEKMLEQAISLANQSIYEHALKNEKIQGMGTTVVCLYFKNSYAYIASVGDSRAYLINQGLIYQINKDHTLIQEKLNLGIYGREQASQDNMRNVLIRTVGYEPVVQVDVLKYKVLKGDIFLLCSDGLYGQVHDQDIVYLVNRTTHKSEKVGKQEVQKINDELVQLANDNGGNDNITSVLLMTK